jgi:hypothetical protein
MDKKSHRFYRIKVHPETLRRKTPASQECLFQPEHQRKPDRADQEN